MMQNNTEEEFCSMFIARNYSALHRKHVFHLISTCSVRIIQSVLGLNRCAKIWSEVDVTKTAKMIISD